MKCPKCGESTVLTKTTRSIDDDVVRQRKCRNCGKEFYTREKIIDFEEGYAAITKFYREWDKCHRKKKKGKEKSHENQSY